MRRPLIVVGVLVALLLGGLVVAKARGDDGSEVVKVAGPAGSEAPEGSTTLRPAVPSPEAAAVAAVAMTGEVARAGFISRRELIESFATPSFGPVLADDTSEQMTSLLREFSERQADPAALQVTEQALRVRVATSTTTTALVDVWSVLVVALPTAATARVMWRTVSLDLLLIDGRWLVDGWKSVPGPTPMVGSESPISPASEVAAVLGWTSVDAAVA